MPSLLKSTAQKTDYLENRLRGRESPPVDIMPQGVTQQEFRPLLLHGFGSVTWNGALSTEAAFLRLLKSAMQSCRIGQWCDLPNYLSAFCRAICPFLPR
jgi:hypothetical protein